MPIDIYRIAYFTQKKKREEGFYGEIGLRRTPEKGTGGSGEGGATRGQGNFELAANRPQSAATIGFVPPLSLGVG